MAPADQRAGQTRRVGGGVRCQCGDLAYFGVLVVVSVVPVQEGWSALAVGLLMLPGALLGVLVFFAVDPVIRRIGAGRTVTLAAVCATVAVLTSLVSLWVSP